MKIAKLALAATAPALLAANYAPIIQNNNSENFNIRIINNIQSEITTNFRLKDQSYYSKIFSKKQLKQLAKAEKLRDKASEGLLLKSTWQNKADELKKISTNDKKNLKKIAKYEAKADKCELEALKTYEKAAETFKEIYTAELKNKIDNTDNSKNKAASNLAQSAEKLYANATEIKKNTNSENTMASYRNIYTKLYNAIEYQELAFGILNNDANIDNTKYTTADLTEKLTTDTTSTNILHAKCNYDFTTDKNIYHTRYYEFENKLKVSDDDKKVITKMLTDVSTASKYMKQAVEYGCSADTFRSYITDAGTLAEKEYYDQKAQESELNECSMLVSAINLETKSNNTLFEIYQKYVPNVRNDNQTAKAYETEAERLYNISKTYETVAAGYASKVEKYTTLSEGNEIKLNAIINMENAIAIYTGDNKTTDRKCFVSDAADRHNDIAMDFIMDESDGSEPIKNTTKQTNNNNQQNNNNQTSAKTTDEKAKENTPSDNKTTTPKSQTQTTTKPSVAQNNTKNNTANSQNKTQTNNNKPTTTVTATSGNTWYYTREDQRIKPYTFPKATVYAVDMGMQKEMLEPVDFPGINKFMCQTVAGQSNMHYYLGDFTSTAAAQQALAKAKNAGYKNATIVTFTNGKGTYQTPANTPVISNGNAMPLSTIGQDGYAVQIAALPTLLNAATFNVNELYYDQNTSGLYRYYTGFSSNIDIAKANYATLLNSGYEDAFLVKITNGQNNSIVSTKNNTNQNASISTGTIYRVQIGAFKESLSKANKTAIDKLKTSYTVHTSKSGQYTVYTVGDCKTRAQAEKIQKDLVNRGFKESYIVTFINGVKQ